MNLPQLLSHLIRKKVIDNLPQLPLLCIFARHRIFSLEHSECTPYKGPNVAVLTDSPRGESPEDPLHARRLFDDPEDLGAILLIKDFPHLDRIWHKCRQSGSIPMLWQRSSRSLS